MGTHRKPSRLDGDLNTLSAMSTMQALKSIQPGGFRAFAAGGTATPATTATVTVKLIVTADAKTDAAEFVKNKGGTVQVDPRDTTVLVVRLPATAVAELEGRSWLVRAEAARELRPVMDKAVVVAGDLPAALASHASGLTGKGVVIGIVDTGVDWKHDSFKAAGKTRIESFVHAVYDQQTETSSFGQFAAAQIDRALRNEAQVPHGDAHGHGTHCASIAAGADPIFKGVAPGASLVAMRSEPLLDTHTIWGIRHAFDVAGDRPCVVSLSLGGHLGPHDGTTALEQMIAQESGPGRIVVVAAGNEGVDGIHWSGSLEKDVSFELPLRIAGNNAQFVDLWIPRGDDVDITIETPDGVRFEPDGQMQRTVFGGFVADYREDPVSRDGNMTLRIAGVGNSHVWKVRMTATAATGQLHAWALEPGTFGIVPPAYSIGMPATADRAIAVGSYVSRASFDTRLGTTNTALRVGQISPFSSRGPARHGGQKPDIVAPGQYITAALASNSQFGVDPRYVARHHPDGKHITIQGTSMSTPFVAGVIALMLEREPRLTPEDIIRRFRATATRDGDSGAVWNDTFGWGKLDCSALFGYRH